MKETTTLRSLKLAGRFAGILFDTICSIYEQAGGKQLPQSVTVPFYFTLYLIHDARASS